MSELQARVDAIQWYHEFEFPGGVTARSHSPDAAQHRRLWRFITAQLERVDFQDKSVLDVGCWDGYWSFYAERRGARYVLASDDATQNWSDGRGLPLARELLHSRIDVRQDLSVYELASLARRFDIIMCFGVFYHLLDPFYALAQIRHCCHPGSLVLLEGDLGRTVAPASDMHLAFHGGVRRALLSAPTLVGMLEATYLRVESQVWMHADGTWRARGLHFAHWLARLQERLLLTHIAWTYPIDRAFLVCAPFEAENRTHPYAPPFGLAAYDTRFRTAFATSSSGQTR
jgi:tRNA (mo5U34)-methyltransferase